MKAATTLVFLLLAGWAAAQQVAQYSLYMLDPVRYNPAYAGLDNSLSITGTFRQQWAGLEGAPSGQRLSAHLPLYFLSSGVGLQVENDRLGARQLTTARLDYNYQLLTGSGVLSLGVSAAFSQLELRGGELRTPDGQYSEPNIIVHNDNLLPVTTVNGQVSTFGAGLYYQSEWLEGGLSVDHLSQPVVDLNGLDWQLQRLYYASLGMHFDLGRALSLHPSAWLRYDGTQTQMDFSALAWYNDNIFGGASFRGYNSESLDAVALVFGFRLSESIRLAYAYDLPLSTLRSVHNGSHEISVNYNLRKRIGAGIPPPVIYHPRAQ